MHELTVTAVGRDRPGIVSALTRALLDLGGNVEDCRAALLSGSFAMVLVVAVPDGVSPGDLDLALTPVADDLDLVISTSPAAAPASHEGRARCTISVYGQDRPGIVHATASALAASGVNIVDLSSRLVGDPPIYVLGVEAQMPEGMGADALRVALAHGDLTGLEISVEPESELVL